jgi:hypothetical protein
VADFEVAGSERKASHGRLQLEWRHDCVQAHVEELAELQVDRH